MRQRCLSPRDHRWGDYGGRGIQICAEWQSDFRAFRDWALSHGYEDGLQLDRINNDGNYEPDNCRWVSRVTNMRNRRNSRQLTAFGETKHAKEWCNDSRCVVGFDLLSHRLRRGWSHEEAITRQRSKHRATA
jgi:hypothetical protein